MKPKEPIFTDSGGARTSRRDKANGKGAAYNGENEELGRVLTRHPLIPSQDEVSKNYKARSAKLRAFCIN